MSTSITILLAEGPVAIVAMDTPKPMLETNNHINFFREDLFVHRVTGVVPTVKTTGLLIASLFLENWFISYRIAVHISTDNSSKVSSTFFKSLSSISFYKPSGD